MTTPTPDIAIKKYMLSKPEIMELVGVEVPGTIEDDT
jgi:hypothetical protein